MFNKIIKIIKIRLIKKVWKQDNSHNSTYLGKANYTKYFMKRIKNKEIINVGKMTYGGLNVFSSDNIDEKLIIGNYCSIASSANFILSGEHRYKTISTFPFKAKTHDVTCEAICKGPIILDDDVWVGDSALILSGVHIHQGAIIAAGSVVVNDIPAYAIVGGSPANIIKYRFNKNIIDKLKKFNWAKFELTQENKEILYKEITTMNVEEILKTLSLNNIGKAN